MTTNKLATRNRRDLVNTFFNGREDFIVPFDSIFDSFFSSNFPDFFDTFGVNAFEKHSYPKVDIIDESDKILINAEIPGLTKDDVKVTIKEGLLSIKGEKREANEDSDDKKYIRRELKHSSFIRSFQLEKNMFKENEVDAEFKDGLLSITIPKTTPKEKEDTYHEVEIK